MDERAKDQAKGAIDVTPENTTTLAAAGNERIVSALRATFAPMASRLTPEIEPAVTFSFRAGEAE